MNIEKKLTEILQLSTETEVVEFKEAKRQYDINKLGKYFSALSNEANLKGLDYGWFVMGVNNDRIISGTSITDIQINNYKKEVSDHITSNISFVNVHRISRDGMIVLLFQIPAAPKGLPIAWKGHYYGRQGESLVALDIQKIEQIRLQVTNEDWSARIIDDASIDDLSLEAIEKAKELYLIKNPKFKDDIGDWDTAKFLNKAKLAIKGKISNTAILLLGKSESEHYLSPGIAKISWILRDKDNIEKDYEHFSCPFVLNVEKVFLKIRNLKYRYLQQGTLFPEEVDQYHPYVIREAINNCIAHQDYTLSGRINVVEKEDGSLTFTNKGSFIPQTIENVITSDAPEEKYRNPFLVNAMVNLNMIDTVGGGIKKMFTIQKNKFFPLPEYNFEKHSVKVTIDGKVIDAAYAAKLAQMPNLSLQEIMLLDKVQKNKELNDNEINELRNKKLIEGRKPNIHISSIVAQKTDQKVDYIRLRGFKDDHYKKMILEYIDKYESANKLEIDNLILDILPDVLSEDQKKNKIRNIVYSMSKRDKTIINNGTQRYPKWVRT